MTMTMTTHTLALTLLLITLSNHVCCADITDLEATVRSSQQYRSLPTVGQCALAGSDSTGCWGQALFRQSAIPTATMERCPASVPKTVRRPLTTTLSRWPPPSSRRLMVLTPRRPRWRQRSTSSFAIPPWRKVNLKVRLLLHLLVVVVKCWIKSDMAYRFINVQRII